MEIFINISTCFKISEQTYHECVSLRLLIFEVICNKFTLCISHHQKYSILTTYKVRHIAYAFCLGECEIYINQTLENTPYFNIQTVNGSLIAAWFEDFPRLSVLKWLIQVFQVVTDLR